MIYRMRLKGSTGEQFAKRAIFLAYVAALGESPKGIGEEAVWDRVRSAGDFSGIFNPNTDDTVFADIVYGKRIKLAMDFGDDFVICTQTDFNPIHHQWLMRYPTAEELFRITASTLGCEVSLEPVSE